MYTKLIQQKPKYVKRRISKIQNVIQQDVKEFLLEFDYNFTNPDEDVEQDQDAVI